MSKRDFSLDSEFYCTLCGNKGIPIVRKRGSKREAGHLKKLFCLICQMETNHAEVQEWTHYSYKDFKFEFDNGNFSEEGLRILSYGEFRAKMNSKGVELP